MNGISWNLMESSLQGLIPITGLPGTGYCRFCYRNIFQRQSHEASSYKRADKIVDCPAMIKAIMVHPTPLQAVDSKKIHYQGGWGSFAAGCHSKIYDSSLLKTNGFTNKFIEGQ